MALVIVGGIGGAILGAGTAVGALGGAALGALGGGLLGGSSSSPNIDMSGQNAAALQQANISADQLQFAKDQAAKAESRQAQFDPKFQAILDQQLTSSKTQDARSAEQWNQYTSTFLPLEQKLASDAIGYNTEGRRTAAGAEARAGVDAAFQRTHDAMTRDLGRAGISQTAGRGATLDAAQRFAQAKASAGADRVARNQVETQGMSLVDNAAKFGRNMTSTGLQAAALATQAGQAGANTLGTQQQTYNASLSPTLQAYQGAGNSAQGAGATYAGINSQNLQQQQVSNQGMAGLGSLAGTLLTSPTAMSTLGSIFSSKDYKHRIGSVSGKHARQSLENAPVERWKYKKGIADEAEHIGPYVEDMKDSGATKGKSLDVISTLGLHHAAISDMSKDVKAIKRAITGSPKMKHTRRTLADADAVAEGGE